MASINFYAYGLLSLTSRIMYDLSQFPLRECERDEFDHTSLMEKPTSKMMNT